MPIYTSAIITTNHHQTPILGNVVTDHITDAYNYLLKTTQDAGIEIEPYSIITICLLIATFLFSACWASGIAKMRNHNPILHFILGLILPILYPTIIFFSLDLKGIHTEEEEEEELHEYFRDNHELSNNTNNEQKQEKTVHYKFGEEYFKKIATDSVGNKTGPWQITFVNNTIKALHIIEPLETAVAVAITGKDGKIQKIRVPYAKITSVIKC